MKNDINKLLQKEMDRKGFLQHVAIGFAAIAGITTIAKTISTLSNNDKNQSIGYGSSAYGGGSQKAQVPRKQA